MKPQLQIILHHGTWRVYYAHHLENSLPKPEMDSLGEGKTIGEAWQSAADRLAVQYHNLALLMAERNAS